MGGNFADGYLMEGKRVFVALPASRELIGRTEEFRRSHDAQKVRWTPPENLHLTMVPPWQCLHVDAVCRALKEVSSALKPFDAVFDHVSFGPDQRRPRLVWATGKAPSGMAEYAKALYDAVGVQGETRRTFLLHLTIARFSSGDYRAMGERRLSEIVYWPARFDTLSLFESILKPAGAEYRELCRFAFGG